MSSEVWSGITVSLLTGGDDPMYSIPLATALAQEGIQVDFIGNDAMRDAIGLQHPNIRYLNLRGSQDPAAPLRSRIARVLRYYRNLIAYAASTDSTLFHILWLNKFEAFDRTLLNLFYKLKGKRLVFTAHNVNTRKRNGTDTRLNRATLRMMYSMIDHIFAHTVLSRDELLREYGVEPSKISVIPHGLNTYVPDTPLTKAEARVLLGLGPEEKVSLFFGQIAPYKGLDILVEAMKCLAPWSETHRLVVAGFAKHGSSSYWPALKSRMEAHPIISKIMVKDGFIPDPEVALYFKAADVLILPYRAIYQSGPLLLAYRFGLPVIATRVGAFDRDIVAGVTGWLCRPEDPEDLARAIRDYYASDLYRNGEESRARVRQLGVERYSWDAIARATVDVYRHLLGTPRRAAHQASQIPAPDSRSSLR